MKLLLDDGDEHVGGHGAPDLRLHRVLAGAQEALDAQVLLDPLEEQLDLPAALVERGDRQRRQRRVVGQEHQRLARLRIPEADAPQMFRVVLRRVEAIEHDALVADHAGAAVRGGGVHPPRVHACLGSRDEERAGLMHRVQPLEVHVAAIHHVEGPSLHGQDVEHVHVVQLALADVDERRDRAAQVQQRVQLDGRLGRAKRRPVEQAQALHRWWWSPAHRRWRRGPAPNPGHTAPLRPVISLSLRRTAFPKEPVPPEINRILLVIYVLCRSGPLPVSQGNI